MPEPVNCARGNRSWPVSASPTKGKGRRQGAKTALFRDNTTAAQQDGRTSLVVWNHNFVPVVVDSKQQSPLKRSPRTSPELSYVQGSPRSSPNHHEISAITYSPVAFDKLSNLSSTAAAHRKRAMSQSPPTPVYAGAKFSEAPPADVLPPPPIRWTDFNTTSSSPQLPTLPPRATTMTPYVPLTPCSLDLQSCNDITNTLKGLLKVQC